MRPIQTAERTVESNFGGERGTMGFYQGAQQKLMTILTRMYSDLPATLIREYATNAWDSHVEAGNTDPILVYLPNLMNRNLRIQDFGVGMTVDDIKLRYSQYGYSSKEHTDAQAGYLGLGSKSALAYTESFTVTAVKNGMRTVATIFRGEKGDGEYEIMDTRATDEPNGVTISIPVRNASDFERAAKYFFRWWKPGTVLVNDVAPAAVTGGLKVADGITVYSQGEVSTNYVIMGGIAYPAGDRLSNSLPYGYRVVAEVPMGSVEFTPSRESLEFTDLTNRTLAAKAQEVHAGVTRAAMEAVNSAKDRPAAIAEANQWRRITRGAALVWRGEAVPQNVSIHGARAFSLTRARNAFGRCDYIELSNHDRYLFITGCTVDTLTQSIRTKIRKYVGDKHPGVSIAVTVDDVPDNSWLGIIPTVSYDDIKAIKLPKAPRSSTGPNEVFTIWKGSAYEHRKVDASKDTQVVLVSPAYDMIVANITRRFPDVSFVTIAKNRWDKFIREFSGKAQGLPDFITERITDEISKMDEADLVYLSAQYNQRRIARGVDASKLNDPDLRDALSLLNTKVNDNVVERFRAIRDNLRGCEDVMMPRIELSEATKKKLRAIDKYPFLRYAGDVPSEHVVDYVNALWAQEQE
jgi:hypothetical protein